MARLIKDDVSLSLNSVAAAASRIPFNNEETELISQTVESAIVELDTTKINSENVKFVDNSEIDKMFEKKEETTE